MLMSRIPPMYVMTKYVIFIALLPCISCQLISEMYCGEDTCYDVLGVTRDSSKSEISRSYRKLAREYHPDYVQNKGASPQEIEEAIEKFQQVATAYETLKDAQAKEEYDYYLDHPEEYYYNYYRYYRRKVNVDVRYVIFGTITAISVFQYISWMTSYNTALNYMLHNTKYRNMAKEEAKSRGLILEKSAQRKKDKFKTQEEKKEDENAILRKVIEENADIKGGYQKPKISDVLWIQIFLLPYHAITWTKFYARWFYRYSYLKDEYTEEDKIYKMRKNLKLTKMRWDVLEEKEKQLCTKRKLWINENAKQYMAEKEEEAKIKMAEDPRWKRYRRFMNKGGPGRMTFED
uniref:dnaJ homolog subfamily C member 25-like n=1 Tax=Styela clava TaxID=7725 RepID=UPI001939CAC8|nr:dnaJ homolog subfamily C member 25-like [Styela clava]